MKTKVFLTFATFALASLTLTSCKGRTMENVEPDGDTVEVQVDVVEDTIISAPIPDMPATAASNPNAIQSDSVSSLTPEQIQAIYEAHISNQAQTSGEGEE